MRPPIRMDLGESFVVVASVIWMSVAVGPWWLGVGIGVVGLGLSWVQRRDW